LEFNVPFQHKYGYIRDENNVENITYLAEVIMWSSDIADNLWEFTENVTGY